MRDKLLLGLVLGQFIGFAVGFCAGHNAGWLWGRKAYIREINAEVQRGSLIVTDDQGRTIQRWDE